MWPYLRDWTNSAPSLPELPQPCGQKADAQNENARMPIFFHCSTAVYKTHKTAGLPNLNSAHKLCTDSWFYATSHVYHVVSMSNLEQPVYVKTCLIQSCHVDVVPFRASLWGKMWRSGDKMGQAAKAFDSIQEAYFSTPVQATNVPRTSRHPRGFWTLHVENHLWPAKPPARGGAKRPKLPQEANRLPIIWQSLSPCIPIQELWSSQLRHCKGLCSRTSGGSGPASARRSLQAGRPRPRQACCRSDRDPERLMQAF